MSMHNNSSTMCASSTSPLHHVSSFTMHVTYVKREHPHLPATWCRPPLPLCTPCSLSAGCTSLRSLSLINAPDIQLSALASLSALTRLTCLELLGCPALLLTQRAPLPHQLSHLVGLRQIKLDGDLHLGDMQVTQEGGGRELRGPEAVLGRNIGCRGKGIKCFLLIRAGLLYYVNSTHSC